MYTKPMILPLDINGKIYALYDKEGKIIGTGTREVCEVLLYIITKPTRKPSEEELTDSAAGAKGMRPRTGLR